MSETPSTGYDTDLPDAATVGGLDLLRAYMTSRQHSPSIGQLLGMTLTRVDVGEADFQLTTQPLFANPLGTVHGANRSHDARLSPGLRHSHHVARR